jgi:hypothetical protein
MAKGRNTSRRRPAKVSGAADYIIPVAVVVAGGIGLWYLWKNVLEPIANITGSAFSLKTGTLVQTPAGPVGISASGPTGTSTTGAGQEPAIQDNISALQWLTNYYNGRGNPPTDCFTGALYTANPGNALIGSGDAQSLFNLIHSQAGTWFSVGDFTGIQAAFQNVVENQTDISYVGSLFQAANGMDLFTYITQGNTFGNGMNPAANNLQLVQQFVQWALSLQQTGQAA